MGNSNPSPVGDKCFTHSNHGTQNKTGVKSILHLTWSANFLHYPTKRVWKVSYTSYDQPTFYTTQQNWCEKYLTPHMISQLFTLPNKTGVKSILHLKWSANFLHYPTKLVQKVSYTSYDQPTFYTTQQNWCKKYLTPHMISQLFTLPNKTDAKSILHLIWSANFLHYPTKLVRKVSYTSCDQPTFYTTQQNWCEKYLTPHVISQLFTLPNKTGVKSILHLIWSANFLHYPTKLV